MLNYYNLNDVEFEYLACDVMSRMLNTILRRFGTGKDGGIDLTNDLQKYEIVVQVKHYTKSTTNQVVASAKKEVVKINKIKPREYYFCCSRDLTPENTRQILQMFPKYMKSEKILLQLLKSTAFLKSRKTKIF